MIGELSEKGVHNGLKNYLEPDKSKQEIQVGRYVADIKNENGIIEIQTKQFHKLVDKIEYYLNLGIPVKVVYPLEVERYIVRSYGTRKSWYKGVVQDSLYEMYCLIKYFDNDLFTFSIIEVVVNEHRNENNNKTKRELVQIVREHLYHNSKEYLDAMVPFEDVFTRKEFMSLGIHAKKLNPLKGLLMNNLLEIAGKRRNELLYKKRVDNSNNIC